MQRSPFGRLDLARAGERALARLRQVQLVHEGVEFFGVLSFTDASDAGLRRGRWEIEVPAAVVRRVGLVEGATIELMYVESDRYRDVVVRAIGERSGAMQRVVVAQEA